MATRHPETQESLTPAQLELIAELIDGVLDEEGRSEALRLLNHSPAAYEVYADSVAVTRGTGHEPEAKPVPYRALDAAPAPKPFTARDPDPWYGRVRSRVREVAAAVRSAPTWQTALPLVAAASLVVILVLPSGSPDFAFDLAQALGADVIATGVATDPPISASRGSTIPGTDAGMAFRLGVRMMDAESAILANRADRAGVPIQLILDVLDRLGANTVIILARDLQTMEPDDRVQVDANVQTVLKSRGGVALGRYQLGKSSEAVRFALLSGDTRLVRAYAQYLETEGAGLSPEALNTLTALTDLIESRDFTAADRPGMLELLASVMTAAAR